MCYCAKTKVEGFPLVLVGYRRISTDTDRQVMDLQTDALHTAGVDERHIFEDRASGSKDDRKGLAAALAFVKPGDCFVVWKLDRLGRSLPHLLETVTGLKERGVAFKSLTEQMDTTTAAGELLFHIFGALAQFERSLIQERVKAGMEAAAKRGRRGGRPRALNDEKMEAVMKALKDGTPKASVCRTFGIARRTLYDSLDRVGYDGSNDRESRI
jgi:DNA invertase Pin-like site-specific DNA recombinase